MTGSTYENATTKRAARSDGPKDARQDLRDEQDCECPEAGRRYFGLSRTGSYDAARRGEIPTIKIGRKIFASIPAIERMIVEARAQPSE